MVIYALHRPTPDPEHGIPCFSTETLAHGALELYGSEGWSVVPVELFTEEGDLVRWRREGRPLHLFVALDRETGTRPAKAYTRPGYYVDEARRNEQEGDARGLLDALRPSVECGLRLWRVSMHRDGTLGPVVSALHLPVWEMEAYGDHLLVGGHHVPAGVAWLRRSTGGLPAFCACTGWIACGRTGAACAAGAGG